MTKSAQSIATVLIVAMLTVLIVAMLAPNAVHHRVPTSVVPRGFCGEGIAVRSAVLTDTAGANTYAVICADNTRLLYTAP